MKKSLFSNSVLNPGTCWLLIAKSYQNSAHNCFWTSKVHLCIHFNALKLIIGYFGQHSKRNSRPQNHFNKRCFKKYRIFSKIMDLHCVFHPHLRRSWNVVAFRKAFARKVLKLGIVTETLNSAALPVNPKWSLFWNPLNRWLGKRLPLSDLRPSSKPVLRATKSWNVLKENFAKLLTGKIRWMLACK